MAERLKRRGLYLCCRRTRPILCLADNVNHLLRLHLRRVCDAHDRHLLGD